MHNNILINGRIAAAAEANINALSSAALYGRGVFTTIAVIGGRAFLWEKHWRRLSADAAAIKIDLGEYSADRLENALAAIIDANSVIDGRARITFFDESAGKLWDNGSVGAKTSLLVTTADRRPLAKPPGVTISSYLINSSSPLAGVKSCNYLENILAKDEAAARGFDEGIRLNERGEIASACTANVFWSENGRLFTPGLKTGCLAGTTRAFVLENLRCTEIEAEPERLARAEAIFLTSAGIGVMRVAEIDGRRLAGESHPILGLIAGNY